MKPVEKKEPFDWETPTIWAISIIGVGLLFWIFPHWNLWQSKLSGESELVRAEQTKKILIETAKAEVEAARLRAEAIEIMGEAAKEYPEYRQQEFIGAFGEALKEGVIKQIIYVPTEANIPILEAGRVGAQHNNK